MTISYPNNVRISGGQFTYNDTADAVITIRFTSGTSFIDGLSIDVAGKFSDAIRVHHHTGRLILQNSSVKGITGVPNGFHGDVLHIQGNGPLQELNLQNVTAMTGYQGLFTPYRPQSGDGTRKLRINRINFSYDPGFAQTSGAGKPLMLLYMGSSTDSYDQVPDRGTWLTKTYVDTSYWANINFPYTNAVYARPVGASSGCATFAASDKIRGQVCSGQPAEGDFAPAGKVGLNYDWSYFCKQPPVMP